MAQILLLEPDMVLSNTYAEALRRAGHKVGTASNAQTAIDVADEYSPDLVVMELQLSVHNGVEFLYEFRSYNEWQTTPVIVQSFVPPSEFKLTSGLWQQLGIVSYLYKPRTSLQQLLTTIEDQLVTDIKA
ncbi:MAG TPA: response regulator [Candidatus Binatia bacterium]|jgi:DNA-binding response OmpR family regulator|nr:response regulator [Candidatus Binatia bacterium]